MDSNAGNKNFGEYPEKFLQHPEILAASNDLGLSLRGEEIAGIFKFKTFSAKMLSKGDDNQPEFIIRSYTSEFSPIEFSGHPMTLILSVNGSSLETSLEVPHRTDININGIGRLIKGNTKVLKRGQAGYDLM